MSMRSGFAVGMVVVAAAVALYVLWPSPPAPGERPATRLSLHEVMAPGGSEGFERATEPRDLSFPTDHGPHPSFQTEWWYFTGNLTAGSSTEGSSTEEKPTTGEGIRDGVRGTGQRFGYQLTFFRSALRPPGEGPADGGASAWRTDQLFMAHFALTDARAGRFHAFERFSRAALELAGARARPFRVWLEDWSATAEGPEGLFPLTLRAQEDGIGLELTLTTTQPIVLQGEAGLSRKGATPGNASYYYSFTRLPTRGRITLAGRELEVEGTSWLDREWSTSALEPGVVGWDWFALQLGDGRDLMFYRLRRTDGTSDPYSGGTLVEADGSNRRLDVDDVELAERRTWRSPLTGAVYPVAWRLSSPLAGVDLEITPLLDAQEHRGTVVYWEGAVDVTGTSRGRDVGGVGYVELTGYGPGE